MSPRLKISSYVIERLGRVSRKDATGCVYGLMYDGTLLVVALSLETVAGQHARLSQHLPTEVDLCGVVHFDDSTSLDKEILHDVDMTDNPLVLTVNAGGELKSHFLVHDRLEETTHEVLSAEDLNKHFIYVRLRTSIPLVCEATVAGVKNSLQVKRKKIASGKVSFHVDGTSTYLLGEVVGTEEGEGEAGVEPTIGQLWETSNADDSGKKKKGNSTRLIVGRIAAIGSPPITFDLVLSFGEQWAQVIVWIKCVTRCLWLPRKGRQAEIMPVNIVMKATKDIVGEKFVKTAVKMVTTQGKPGYSIKMPLLLDGLALVPRGARLSQLYGVLVETACRSLRVLEAVTLHQLGQEGIGDGAGLQVPDTFHYEPPALGHLLSRVLPRNQADDCSESERVQLHAQLDLPTDRPLFRRGNALLPSAAAPGLLVSPHEALPAAPAAPGVLRATVRGRYTYHHYLQDRIDDDGWGCAYRSLQTLCSWFRLQGYTEHKIPTHREIQQCLADMGDKPASFVGSRQWIGSTEVSFCLESLLRVSSRILFAASGAELREYTPELVHHFRRNGSPVMIGGGVLAHTILGVEYDPATQAARYLVLDPHYAGPDHLPAVLAKGWCAWKTADFWSKTAHYNLCLPQTRPCV